MKSRTTIAKLKIITLYLAASALVPLLLSLLFSVITWDFSKFLKMFSILWLLFGGNYDVAAVFVLFEVAKGYEGQFAAGFYYGGLFCQALIGSVTNNEIVPVLFGFLISGLICYIVWLKHFKNCDS